MRDGDTKDLWSAAKANPTNALQDALAAVDQRPDPEPLAWAYAAAGRAHFELGQNEAAIAAFEKALLTATAELRSLASISLGAALSSSGRSDEARECLDLARRSPVPATSALAHSQLGMIELHAGNVVGALELLEPAIEVLGSTPGEEEAHARALGNAGYCELLLGRLDSAIARFREASALASRSGQTTVVSGCLQNIGYALMRKGDLAEALLHLEQARDLYRQNGDPGRNLSTLLDDLAETYRIAGLTNDAVNTATESLTVATETANLEKQADAAYRLARCELDAGASSAIATAGEAAEMFRAAGRDHWVSRSRLIQLEAQAELSALDAPTLNAALDTLIEYSPTGWELEERSVRNLVALQQLRSGSPAAARQVLGPAGSIDADQSVMAEIEERLTLAITAALDGTDLIEHADAAAELGRKHAARLADPEMRAGATRLMNRLRRLFVGSAVDDLNPIAAFEHEERFRNGSLSIPRATPSRDVDIAAISQELRDLSRALEDPDAPAEAAIQVQQLEGRLRRRSFQLQSEGQQSPSASATAASVISVLRGRRFLEWIEVDGTLSAISGNENGFQLHACARLCEIHDRSNTIRGDLARLARPGLSAASSDRRWASLTADCAALADLLIPDSSAAAERNTSMVISPPNFLIDLPWSLILGGLDQAVSVSIVPSASWWLHNEHNPATELQLGAVVGPGLNFASKEVASLLETYGSQHSAASTAPSALSAIDDASLLHVAAHGHFRHDSPRFSNLQLDDGALALHELDRVENIPSVVVLAACDAGRHTSTSGGDVLGFAPAWLSAGAQSVVGPVCAVGDEATTQIIAHLYDSLIEGGLGVATALAQAQQRLHDAPSQVRAAAASFIVIGYDRKFVSKK